MPEYSSLATTVVSVTHPLIPKSIEWSSFEGAKLSHATQKFYTAPNVERTYRGKSSRETATVKAHLDPVAHAGFIAAANAGEVFEGAVIQVQSVDRAGVPIGTPDIYSDCMLTGFPPRQANLNSEDMQMIETEWEVPAP